MTNLPEDLDKVTDETLSEAEASKWTYPVYVICAPFVHFEEALKFREYSKAADYAQKISTYAREFKVDVRIFEHEGQEIGILVSSFEMGEMSNGIQVSFLQSQNAPASQVRRKLGKTWMQVLEQYSVDIRNMTKRLIPLSEEEYTELQFLKDIQKNFLSHLKQNMPERVYLAAKWTYVDNAGYKHRNKDTNKPQLLHVDDSTVRKDLTKAYEIVAEIVMREKWKLTESARATFEQFLVQQAADEETKQNVPSVERSKKPRKRRKVKEDPAQLSLFDEAFGYVETMIDWTQSATY
ncbi:hypothetical protein LLE49_20115 [Alicyclobacillus tolerans]|uniref:hypothetical protein n=1 Tax=Alicyclobacillus tolerans TaxID=90970 RepID=UPI001F1C9DC2|nr:hypothetical protein [Alicyclobacillus tolerans]MCF8567030.1 hypothetical protein [Alicyclobacillus tolerans]